MEKTFQVTLNDTDLNKVLEDIIQHKNKKEIAKLLSPLLLDNLEVCDWLFKLILGGNLPDVIPDNTLCLVDISRLNYTVDKSLLLGSKLDNGEGQIVCTIEKFRGFHSNFYTYDIKHKVILESGEIKYSVTGISYKSLTVIEEF